MRSIFLQLLFALIVMSPVNGLSAEDPSFFARYAPQRQIFLDLKNELAAGELEVVKSRIDELDGYPLREYLDFLILEKEIKQHRQPASLLPNIQRMRNQQRLQRKLLGAAKNRSVKLERWKDYAQIAAADNAPVHPCDDLLSGFKNGAPVKFDKSTADLWVTSGKHTNSCDEAFALLLSSVDDVPTGAVWRRAVNLLESGKTELTADLLKYFNKRDRRVIQAWIEGIEKPEKILRSEVIRGTSVHHQQMATTLLKRWARDDLVAATDYWSDHAKHFGFSQKRIDETISRYAVLSAKRGMPESISILNKAVSDRDVRYWRIRQSLLESQWQQCIFFLDALTEKEKAEDRWKYWRGRCLESQGFKSAANRTYDSIAEKFSYYGFLAADRLSKSYQIKSDQPLVNEAEIKSLRESKGIARAIEYFLVDLPWEGRSEWNKVLKSSDKQRYIAAARLAESIGWHDRALRAIGAAGEKQALTTLYPAPYPDYVKSLSGQFSVGRELIYAVMRRESAFIRDIKSSAGAVGLMQLMPATAKQVGKQLGVKAPKWKLIDSDLNIKLGVKYLNHLLKRFDGNMVLSTAAYNAGPTRVRRWMANKPIAADIWVETIPFDETRSYVKAVLFNSVVFDSLLGAGTPVKLSEKMPDLLPPQ